MKRNILLLLVMLLVLGSLVGCSSYTSHYSAIAHVRTNSSDSAMVSFHEFVGTDVFQLKCKSDQTAKIQYSGKLESGSLTVYYDCGGMKKELFSLQAGDEIEAFSEPLAAGKVYIIVETNEKCLDGVCSFTICYD